MTDSELIENLRFMLGGMADNMDYPGAARTVETAADRLEQLTTPRPMETAPAGGAPFLCLLRFGHGSCTEWYKVYQSFGGILFMAHGAHSYRVVDQWERLGWLPLPEIPK